MLQNNTAITDPK